MHRGDPVYAVVGPFVVGGLGSAVFTEDTGATGVVPLPDPGTVFDGEVVPADIALAVKEVDLVLLARGVVADHLDAADADVANANVGGMNNEEAAGCPLVDIAGEDLDVRSAVGVEGVAFGDPAADDDT